MQIQSLEFTGRRASVIVTVYFHNSCKNSEENMVNSEKET